MLKKSSIFLLLKILPTIILCAIIIWIGMYAYEATYALVGLAAIAALRQLFLRKIGIE